MNGALYVLTGSCASGKTTILRALSAAHPGIHAHRVDDAPQPSAEEMAAVGGPSALQASLARRWAERAAAEGGMWVVDGQVRPTEMVEAARGTGVRAVRVVLVDCGHAERRRRLRDDRGQPELDCLDSYAWAAYLRGQADALGLEVVDTEVLGPQGALRAVQESLARFAAEAGVPLACPAPAPARMARR